MEEYLIQGQQFANQLQFLLHNGTSPIFGDRVLLEESAKELTSQILQSFKDALSLLISSVDTTVDDCSKRAAPLEVFSPNSNESGSMTNPLSVERKVCLKRRKTSHTWIRLTPTPIDDGHAWRKYGQKVIHNNTFPRSYYRCTYKNDQGCQATKQVQKTDENPSMYQTTYMGHHTCKETFTSPHELMLEDSNPNDGSCYISFESNGKTNNKQTANYTFSSLNSSNKQVKEEEEQQQQHEIAKVEMINRQDSFAAALDRLCWPDLETAFESFGPTSMFETTSSGSAEQEDNKIEISSAIYSCTSSYYPSFVTGALESSFGFSDEEDVFYLMQGL